MVITTRREFCALAAAGALSLLTDRAPALCLRIGIVAPSDPADARVRAALDGVTIGIEEARRTATLFGAGLELLRADVSTPADAAAAAARLVDQGAQVLLSLLDVPATRALRDVAREQRRLVIHLIAPATLNSATATEAPTWSFHVAPTLQARAEAVLEQYLHERVPAERIALLARSPMVAREASAIDVRIAGRIGRGPLFRGDAPGAGRSVLVLAAFDAAGFEALLEHATGAETVVDLFGASEALDPARLPAGLVRADAWLPTLERYGAAQLNDRFRARFGPSAGMRGPAWAGWFAAKAVAEAALRARADTAAALHRALHSARFDGHKGAPLAFAPDGTLAQPLYIAGLPA